MPIQRENPRPSGSSNHQSIVEYSDLSNFFNNMEHRRVSYIDRSIDDPPPIRHPWDCQSAIEIINYLKRNPNEFLHAYDELKQQRDDSIHYTDEYQKLIILYEQYISNSDISVGADNNNNLVRQNIKSQRDLIAANRRLDQFEGRLKEARR